MTPATPRRSIVASADAPSAIGPYSHAVRHGDVLYCSGMLPIDATDGSLVCSSAAAETTECLKNLSAVCRAVDCDLSQALRLTIYTTALDRFAEINEAYGAFFASDPPARAAIGVAALPKGARVEIDAIVAVGS